MRDMRGRTTAPTDSRAGEITRRTPLLLLLLLLGQMLTSIEGWCRTMFLRCKSVRLIHQEKNTAPQLPCVGVEWVNHLHLKRQQISTDHPTDGACGEFKAKRGAVVGELQRCARHGQEPARCVTVAACQSEAVGAVHCLIHASGVHAIGFKRHFCLIDDSHFALSHSFTRQNNIISDVTIACSPNNRVFTYIQNLQKRRMNVRSTLLRLQRSASPSSLRSKQLTPKEPCLAYPLLLSTQSGRQL